MITVHGKSVRSKEDLGMYGGGADAMLQDIHIANCLIMIISCIPLILSDTAWALLAACACAAHHDSCMDMLIVCGSMMAIMYFCPALSSFIKVGKTVFGSKHSVI